MKKYLLLPIFIVAIVACKNTQQAKVETEYKSLIKGLASPIRLSPDTTSVRMKDYFLSSYKLDSVLWQGSQIQVSVDGLIKLVSLDSTPLISNLSVYAQGIKHDIPVFKSEKLKYIFTYTSPNIPEMVYLSGSMNGWNRQAGVLAKEGDTWKRTLLLEPGRYQYRIWEGDKEMLDKNNTVTADNGMGGLNNVFVVGSENSEPGTLTTLKASSNKVVFLASKEVQNLIAYFENSLLDIKRISDTCEIFIPESAKNFERSFIRVFADNGQRRSNDLLIPLNRGEVIKSSEQLSRTDMHSSVMYFMMVDRFFDGSKKNNRPTEDKEILPQANNMGGDISGITQKIKSGYFRDLGINTIWVSPISRNAEGAWGLWNKGVNSKFSAYHGYWPTALTSIDDRFGSDSEFKELIQVAHENNMNVILDYVAHHLHNDHPLVKDKPDWFTPLYLPDGTMNTEKWDEHRLTTWFDTFLPTLDFSKPEVVSALTDSAMYWVKNYDLDGFRHDATKHIPNEFWQELTYKVKNESEKKIYQIGETYGNPELIGSYLGSGILDAQFDFNLYDAMVDAFAKDQTGFENLNRVLQQSLYSYGSHHLMGNITGNQDRTRFTSYADGSVKFEEDPKLAGWTRNIENRSDQGFYKMGALQAFLMTVPGIPCVYYGDEIAMPGANDPDNRRMMLFDGLNANQSELKMLTSLLVKARNSSLAFSYGDFRTISCQGKNFVFLRNYFDKTAIVIFSKTKDDAPLELVIPKGLNLDNLNAFNGSSFEANQGKVVITKKSENFKKYGFEILMN